ncbi:MAG: hypothetical protein H5T68_11790 [Chloroflexi bacterium]|nr:hypothetical protein [Chloroflexota bacterium]
MGEKIWFEEELLPPQELADEVVKGLLREDRGEIEKSLRAEKALDFAALEAARDKAAFLDRFVKEKAKGILRVYEPRWRPLTAEEKAGLPVRVGDVYPSPEWYLVRIGVEFDVLPESREAGWYYESAWCRTSVFNPSGGVQPRVVDIFPQRIYSGFRDMVKVAIGPGITAGRVEAKLGEVGMDLHVGQVTPVTLGFFGEGERAPYWELRSKDFPILGAYHFWMVVEKPLECQQVHIIVWGEGNLRSQLFVLPVGPKVRVPEQRKKFLIAA